MSTSPLLRRRLPLLGLASSLLPDVNNCNGCETLSLSRSPSICLESNLAPALDVSIARDENTISHLMYAGYAGDVRVRRRAQDPRLRVTQASHLILSRRRPAKVQPLSLSSRLSCLTEKIPVFLAFTLVCLRKSVARRGIRREGERETRDASEGAKREEPGFKASAGASLSGDTVTPSFSLSSCLVFPCLAFAFAIFNLISSNGVEGDEGDRRGEAREQTESRGRQEARVDAGKRASDGQIHRNLHPHPSSISVAGLMRCIIARL